MTRSDLPPVGGPRLSVLSRIGGFATRRRRAVLATGAVLTIVFALFGLGVTPHLSQGGFNSPDQQSEQAAAVLGHEFHAGAPNVFLLVTARRGSVDDPAAAAAGASLTHRLAAQHGVVNVESYWSLGKLPTLRSQSGRQALIVARIAGDENQIVHREPQIAATFAHVPAAVRVGVGGYGPAFHEVDTLVERGLLTADLIAVPITFVLLLIVYGSVVAALLPLVGGGVAVVGTLLVLRVLTALTGVSIFAENLTTALGFGLAIDYSLFFVSRFREELAAGHDTEAAVRRTVVRAGRTVGGSALAVAGSLAVLLVFPLMFLRSFAYAGIAVALLSGAAAVVVLPALLAVLGPRVNALTVWRRSVQPADEGFWSRMARTVMRRPVLFLIGGVALLAVLGSPFLGLRVGYLDYRVLHPQIRCARSTTRPPGCSERVRWRRSTWWSPPRQRRPTGEHTRNQLVDRYATALSRLPGVRMVSAETGVFLDGTRYPPPAVRGSVRRPEGDVAVRRAHYRGAVHRWCNGGTRGARGAHAARRPRRRSSRRRRGLHRGHPPRTSRWRSG